MVFSSVKKVFAALAVSGVLSVSAASAATLNVTYQGSDAFGTPDLSQQVGITSTGYSGQALAGPFRLTGDNGYGNFVAFCVDLAKYMTTGSSYTTSANSAFGATVDGVIDKLFTSAYAGIVTSVQGAAFQIALWEIISDTGSGYNLAGGSFTAKASRSVITQANAYLSGLAGAASGGYNVTFLTSGNSQNLVTVSPVPVPAALGMLGLGLFSLVGLRRRKKS